MTVLHLDDAGAFELDGVLYYVAVRPASHRYNGTNTRFVVKRKNNMEVWQIVKVRWMLSHRSVVTVVQFDAEHPIHGMSQFEFHPDHNIVIVEEKDKGEVDHE